MYRINFTTLSLLLVLGTSGLMSEPTSNADESMKNLYDSLLQREYVAPVPYADHQITRKAARSPSLRLRFGRRSDPSVPLQDEMSQEELMETKSIRSPQLRLRFGRNDPMWSSFNENALLEEKRAPTQRLRFGRSGSRFQSENVLDQRLIRAPQLRLRFGRSDPSWIIFNEHKLNANRFPKFSHITSELNRISDPSAAESESEQTNSDETESTIVDEK
ncbi:short neuropeptide F [Toxorhynchites rutilus septentrionalis]|uniref:short neuropeptide F n=1 Tax=Toxorhynchites rutilus septentrionalis TaxID=329112 RepID=UPI00247ADC63|nr:short neuropeptide F [Toxorhynchites rutilus septentrionalis]XP_055641219.1 short neuropeptide F [Toxorhynchites rutilus septentrionalis]